MQKEFNKIGGALAGELTLEWIAERRAGHVWKYRYKMAGGMEDLRGKQGKMAQWLEHLVVLQ